jgi:signal transduction histidine kinase
LLKICIWILIEAIGFRKDEVSEITVKIETQDENVLLTISNTNSFIPNKDLERIFEPHFTTKKNGTNKGLGLALTMSIIKAHNGKIKVSSENKLTSFEVTLPNYDAT